ncbi:MAG: peptidoglycan DD-metalloendopeptidase family protein [Nitrospirota bacterium]
MATTDKIEAFEGEINRSLERRLMRKTLITALVLLIAFLTIRSNLNIINAGREKETTEIAGPEEYREIKGNIEKGETLFDIFKKYGIQATELFRLREASADVHRLRELYPGRQYKIILDTNQQVNSFEYWINDDTILNITRTESGFSAEKISIQYEKRTEHIGGIIRDNLISSIGDGRENLLLALQLSDIFAWDIDFTADLRNNDEYKIIVEGLYLDGEFKKYGDIISAEFVNNNETYYAYRFEHNGKKDYYDGEGKSLRKAFLKAPLSFRRISSGFSRGRFHPILKIYRPHHGLDYAAPAGTPVSAAGDGTVVFAGRKGQYGKLIILRHRNGYRTYYGHLSGIAKSIRSGKKVDQGQVVGYVGATGLATGPHLHYEMRINNKPVNPLKLKIPRGDSIPKKSMAEFRTFKNMMDTELASITPRNFIAAAEIKTHSSTIQ